MFFLFLHHPQIGDSPAEALLGFSFEDISRHLFVALSR